MSIVQTVSSYNFHDAFTRSDSHKDQFSYNARQALYEYLDDLSDQIDQPIELDIVALCCEYSEYESCDKAASNYFEYEGMTFDEDWTELISPEEVEEKARQYLQDNTTIIEFDGGVIIQNF